jgi:hypothetical protein
MPALVSGVPGRLRLLAKRASVGERADLVHLGVAGAPA